MFDETLVFKVCPYDSLNFLGIAQTGVHVFRNGFLQRKAHRIVVFQKADGGVPHPHGVFHGPVNIPGGGNPLLDQVNRLPEQRLGKAVHQKSRNAAV